jgi:hypothetical protein
MIYEYVILSDEEVIVYKGGSPAKPTYHIGKPIPYKTCGKSRSGAFLRPAQDERNLWDSTPTLAIAFTCRQMYLEAAPIWYANVRFAITLPEDIVSFLQSIGPRNRDAIQHISVNMNLSKHRQTDDIYEPISTVLHSSCRIFRGLRTIILVRGRFNIGYEHPSDRIMKAAKHLLKTESRMESVTLLGVMKCTKVGKRMTYLRDCQMVKRRKNSHKLGIARGQIDMFPTSGVRIPLGKHGYI